MTTQDEYKEMIFQKIIHVLNALLCRLYGEKDATILRPSWVPIIAEIVAKGLVFKWGTILSSVFNQVVKKSMIIYDQQESNFFMSSYIVDAPCRGQHFPSMNWA